MRIKDDCFQVEDKKRICLELQDLLQQSSPSQARPCPGCRFTFDKDPSTITTKYCSSRCPYISKQMSSEPEKYPIEAQVAPLVYAFYTMRLMMPCWSCEGHLNQQGELSKFPRVWFYSTSHFFPKLLAQYVGQLKGIHKTNCTWTVRVLSFSQSMFSTTYSLEPNESEAERTPLAALRQDMDVIGRDLRKEMLILARSYLARGTRNNPTLLQ